ncbi:FadR/GntR family transcriptional regulator [Nonomuraea antimicrobica]|uniref:FadR/GntR family transcriptional regulator n=1 Tax=Nonomuraea antimicrobica TaxID=561173 RepID=A0ABP7B6U8_9ACTN
MQDSPARQPRTPLARLAKPSTIHESVQEALRGYIIDNRLRPGDAMPSEGDLAQQLGISRNSVREAVKALMSLGILETRRGSGVYVTPFSLSALAETLPYSLLFDLDELSELLEIRRVLETGLIERAITDMTEATRDRLRRVVDDMREQARRGRDVIQQDRAFHHTLFEDAGNRVLLKVLDAFWVALHEALATRPDIHERAPAEICADHEAIYRAVLDRDIERARRTLEDHYTEIRDRIGERR